MLHEVTSMSLNFYFHVNRHFSYLLSLVYHNLKNIAADTFPIALKRDGASRGSLDSLHCCPAVPRKKPFPQVLSKSLLLGPSDAPCLSGSLFSTISLQVPEVVFSRSLYPSLQQAEPAGPYTFFRAPALSAERSQVHGI